MFSEGVGRAFAYYEVSIMNTIFGPLNVHNKRT